MNIIDFIPKGRKNAVTTEELKARTGFDVRTIRQHIANARLKGTVICSSLKSEGGGYFLPESPDEALEYVRTEQNRIESANMALQGAVKYISEQNGGDRY
ncbi:MAG: hypothetical protein ACLU4K_11155 [Oscillospiraceae bacterium]